MLTSRSVEQSLFHPKIRFGTRICYKPTHNLKVGSEFVLIASEDTDLLNANPKLAPKVEDFNGSYQECRYQLSPPAGHSGS